MSRIEGVPAGMKLVRFGPVRRGELCMRRDGTAGVYDVRDISSGRALVVAWDNVYDCDLLSVSIPEGYERAGNSADEWFRVPQVGEIFRPAAECQAVSGAYPWADDEHGRRRIILRKITPKTHKVLVIEVDAFSVTIPPIRATMGVGGVGYCCHDLNILTTRIEERSL